MRWAVNVARMGERRSAGGGDMREICHLEDPGVDGSIIIKMILR